MSKNRYFINFPIITYENVKAIDITERVVFLNSSLKNPYLFYPYDLTDDERADQFANRYYNDPYKSWILYLGNQIVDPYYEWYMPQNVFNDYLNSKYKSINPECPISGYQLAQNKIKSYQNNWYDSENISLSDYDALPPTLIKYWQPVYGFNDKIISYKRVQSNNTINTNGIRSYVISNTSFIENEVCNIVFSNNATGQGQVLSLANNTLFLQHLSGTTYSNTNMSGYIYGEESGVNTSFSNSTFIVDNLLPEEVLYWSPVTYYDFENFKNEYNKTIKVLDSAYTANVSIGLKSLLS